MGLKRRSYGQITDCLVNTVTDLDNNYINQVKIWHNTKFLIFVNFLAFLSLLKSRTYTQS